VTSPNGTERSGEGLPLRVERDNECQLCRLLDYRGDEINGPEGTVVIPRDDGGLKTIHCCERCADELWGDESGWTPYGDGNLVTDGGETLGDGSDRFSPNAIERYSGTKKCNYDGHRETADWEIHLVDRHGTPGLVRACDEHVEIYWGYRPEESRLVETEGDQS